MRQRHSCLLILLVLFAACSREPAGDRIAVHKLVTETRTDALSLPGQFREAAVETTTLWLGPDGLARRDGRASSFLIDAARSRLTTLDHAHRTWTTLTTDQVAAQLAFLAADTTGGADLPTSRLHSLLKVLARVTDTGENAEVDGYRCRRWIVELHLGNQITSSEIWLTRDIPVDYALLHQATQPALAALPGGQQALAELQRLEGVPVRSASNLRILSRKGHSESRLLSAAAVEVPGNWFDIPPDYAPAQLSN
jgi:hypothetical protein